jgi:hypothetical protein
LRSRLTQDRLLLVADFAQVISGDMVRSVRLVAGSDRFTGEEPVVRST